MAAQVLSRTKIDPPPAEQRREFRLDRGEPEQPGCVARFELDQEVDVTLRLVRSLEHRTEERQLPDVVPATESRERIAIDRQPGIHVGPRRIRSPDRHSSFTRVAGSNAFVSGREGGRGRWFAAAKDAGLLDVALARRVAPQNSVSEEEYQELVELARQQGALAETEGEIILQILRLDRRTARDVMRPRSQMRCIPDDLSVPEMLQEARRFRHRRLPMYDENPDTIVGVLNTRTLLLDPEVDLSEAIEFPSFVPETMNLLQLLQSLQRQQRGLAIVLDEFGGTAGIVTLEDILEEMIGRIRGESEAESLVMHRLGDGKWRISAAMRLDDFRREFPELGEFPGVETMGGLMLHESGVVPAVGDSAVCAGLKLMVTQADERRVRELVVEVVRKRGTLA